MQEWVENLSQINFFKQIDLVFVDLSTILFFSIEDSNAWSDQGCWKISETKTHVKCKCNHLTNFALLMDVYGEQKDLMELKVITWIGCGVSLLGLILTFITFAAFRC